MSHARQHGRDHRPVRQHKRGAGHTASPRARAAAHWAAGTPALPVLIVFLIVFVDLVGGTGRVWLPLLAAGPALAAATSRPAGVLGVGLLATVLGAGIGVRHGMP
ncbi:serine/threonine-protein phosphatase, partial [Streptomyces sp. NPDC005009]